MAGGKGGWLPTSVAGGAGGTLAYAQHNPASVTGYNSASTTLAALDTTNLRVSFTAPASNAVVVSMCALAAIPDPGATQHSIEWGLLSGATPVTGSRSRMLLMPDITAGVFQHRATHRFIITGLTAGATYTWDWAQARDAGGTHNVTTYAGGIAGPALMDVWAA